MRRGLTLALTMAGLASATATARPLTPDLMIGTREVTGPAISPDGRWIAFELTSFGSGRSSDTDLWIVPSSGAAPPRLLAGGPADQSAAHWSPDGGRVAFIEDGALKVADARTFASQAVAQVGSRFSDVAWSPDGRTLAYAARGLFVVAATGGDPRRIARGADDIDDVAWSPDGREIAINADGALHVVDAATGAIARTLSRAISKRWSRRHVFGWSPDGRRILFAELAPADVSPSKIGFWLATVPAQGGAATPILKDHPGTITKAVWAADSRHLFAQSFEGTASRLVRIDTARGAVETLVPDVLAEKSFAASDDGRTLAYVGASPTAPATIRAWTRAGGSRALADFNPQLKGVAYGAVRPLTWRSGGRTVSGVLVLPVGYRPGRRYPMVVQLHGGPHYAWWRGYYGVWDEWAQLLAGRGYAVLLPNPRGSTGGGNAFSLGNVNDVGRGPLTDVLAGVDAVVAMGIADPRRLGVGGWSYGGYLTAWTITQTDRFKAAVVGAGIVRTGTDQQVSLAEYYDNLPAAERGRALADVSPITHVGRVVTPTLILHGRADSKISYRQAEELHDGLVRHGVPTEIRLYEREGHSILDADHQTDLIRRVADWYDRYLKPAATR